MAATATAPALAYDWDDLRFFLALAREGSLSAAGAALGVTHTTVSRRMSAFETRLGVRLFERLPTGYVPTPAGEELRDAAERVEREVAAVDRRVLGRDARLSGTIRVTLPDIVATTFMPHVEAFGREYPEIALELATGTGITNLTRREADVALRVTARPAEHLVGRRVASLSVGLYASRGYLARRGDVADWREHRFIGWDEAMPEIAPLRWLRENVPPERIALRVNTPLVMLEAVRTGVGVGQLLCRSGDLEPSLVRVAGPDPEQAVPLWLLTHRDLRHVARIRAFLDFLAERIAAERPALEVA
jgi:DNA-binding transcriptional LysR family regulator